MTAPIQSHARLQNTQDEAKRLDHDNDGMIEVKTDEPPAYDPDDVTGQLFQVIQLKDDGNGRLVPVFDFVRAHA